MIDVTSQDQGQAPDVDFVALRPGQKIGRYEILAVLGQGGFGITYRAYDSQLNREVAIKEYLPSALAIRQDGTTVLPRSTKMADDFSWGRQRFVDEGRTLATLQRAPAIVRVFDFLEANGTAYIVMELLPGITLEDRLKGGNRLTPADVDRILWPLLDGLEQVHAVGFLHRDIKPANILLDAAGNPTLIDFGASRAAMAGRSAAMTAIFTPGYAAAEQITSAKQGPWTDIYGISATLHHVITGAPPPSAFDRMLDDTYEPLAKAMPAGFPPGLLIGIDAGLAVRANDRPQSIAGWRPVLAQTGALDAQATVALGKTADTGATMVVRSPPPTAAPMSAAPAKRRARRWIGLVAVIFLLAGGGRYFTAAKHAVEQALSPAPAATMEADKASRAQAEELARLRAEKQARDAADADAAQRRQIEEETRQKIEAEMAAKQKAAADEAAARQKAEADEAAKRQAEENDRRSAESAETALHLSSTDQQHVQVSLTALGFNTNGTDGVFGGHTRDMITAWQKSRSLPATGFLTGPESQSLQRDAAPAIAKFDDDQKKAEDARKKADEDKAKAEALAARAPPSVAVPAPAPSVASTGPGGSADGHWRGTYQCSANKMAGEFVILLDMTLRGGAGKWVRPGSGPGTKGNQAVNVLVSGTRVAVERLYYPTVGKNMGTLESGTMAARFEGGTITGSGPESNSAGRTCHVILTRG